MTPVRLKSLIRTELENTPDTCKNALIFSEWFWKYRQVVPHSCEVFPLLNAVKSGKLFREWWACGGPSEFAPSMDKLLKLAIVYVHKHIPKRSSSAYLHGCEGLQKPLVPSGTK